MTELFLGKFGAISGGDLQKSSQMDGGYYSRQNGRMDRYKSDIVALVALLC
jgi:hypothetical protein